MHQSAAPLSPAEAARADTAPPQVSSQIPFDASPEGRQPRGIPPQAGVGESRRDLTMLSRVHRIQREIEACRPVSDADLLQHARDLTSLMQQAWDAYESDRTNDYARAEAEKRKAQIVAARRLLSDEWKAAREAQIQQAIGAGYFIDAGDRGRAERAANEGSAA